MDQKLSMDRKSPATISFAAVMGTSLDVLLQRCEQMHVHITGQYRPTGSELSNCEVMHDMFATCKPTAEIRILFCSRHKLTGAQVDWTALLTGKDKDAD